MNFDSEGHIVITPHQLFQLAIDNPTRLVDHYLIKGTPHAFPSYATYGEFLHAVSERIGVHPVTFACAGVAGWASASRHVWGRSGWRWTLSLISIWRFHNGQRNVDVHGAAPEDSRYAQPEEAQACRRQGPVIPEAVLGTVGPGRPGWVATPVYPARAR